MAPTSERMTMRAPLLARSTRVRQLARVDAPLLAIALAALTVLSSCRDRDDQSRPTLPAPTPEVAAPSSRRDVASALDSVESGSDPSAPCDEAVSTWDMIYCYDGKTKAALGRLSRATDSMRALSAVPARWDSAHVAWEALRYRDCMIVGKAFEGGTFESVARSVCFADYTEVRATWLEAQLR